MLHLVPPPVGDTGPQFCMLTHGRLVLEQQEDLQAPGPQLADSAPPVGRVIQVPMRRVHRGYWGAL